MGTFTWPWAVPARDLADLGRAAIVGLLQYAAVDEPRRDHDERLVESVPPAHRSVATPRPSRPAWYHDTPWRRRDWALGQG